MNTETKSRSREVVCTRPAVMPESLVWAMYCPGCQEPVIGRIIGEALDELGVADRAIMIIGVGCHAFMGFGFEVDAVGGIHGRAPDLATAIKRIYQDTIVFTIQGDGDCIAIGSDPFIGALTRGEKITVVMFNNSNYGTTGGQLAPTTLMGQTTTTTPKGRDAAMEGYPVHTAELAATFKGVCYAARGAVNTPANYQRAKRYVKTAFQKQIDNVGLSFVEVIAACPPNWHLSPVDCLKRIEEETIAEFPLGEFKNVDRIE